MLDYPYHPDRSVISRGTVDVNTKVAAEFELHRKLEKVGMVQPGWAVG